MGDVMHLEVVHAPVLQAVAVADTQGALAQMQVGAQVVGHVEAVTPPAHVGEILVVAQVDFVIALVIFRRKEDA